ncbi:MAG: alpha/beta hydrolase [Sphingomonadales bacterium]|nr:alpha/beta hydrolase [Sphingomonadales bacterium]
MPSDAYKALVEQLFASPMPTDIAEMREAYRAMGDAFPLPDDVSVSRATLGRRPAEWLTVAEAPRNIVLLVHGGGYCIGGLDSHRHLGGEIARQTNSRVAVIDYRLAPEHPYPAGLDDLKLAYAELIAAAGGEKVALVGDSAGAGLVMALLAELLRETQPLPASIYCMSPWADLSDTATSRALKRTADPLASIDQLAKMASLYTGDIPVSDPRVSPAFADFRGSPPVFIQVGTAEVLMDDALNLAKSLADADVDVDVELRAGMIHVWPWFFPAIPEGAEALARACAFLSRHFGGDA